MIEVYADYCPDCQYSESCTWSFDAVVDLLNQSSSFIMAIIRTGRISTTVNYNAMPDLGLSAPIHPSLWRRSLCLVRYKCSQIIKRHLHYHGSFCPSCATRYRCGPERGCSKSFALRIMKDHTDSGAGTFNKKTWDCRGLRLDPILLLARKLAYLYSLTGHHHHSTAICIPRWISLLPLPSHVQRHLFRA